MGGRELLYGSKSGLIGSKFAPGGALWVGSELVGQPDGTALESAWRCRAAQIMTACILLPDKIYREVDEEIDGEIPYKYVTYTRKK